MEDDVSKCSDREISHSAPHRPHKVYSGFAKLGFLPKGFVLTLYCFSSV